MDDVTSTQRLDYLLMQLWEDDGGLAPDASASGVTSPSVPEVFTTVAAKTPVTLLDPAAAPLCSVAPTENAAHLAT